MNQADIAERNNVRLIGQGERLLVMAHGFGCDQNVWRFMTPELARSGYYCSIMSAAAIPDSARSVSVVTPALKLFTSLEG